MSAATLVRSRRRITSADIHNSAAARPVPRPGPGVDSPLLTLIGSAAGDDTAAMIERATDSLISLLAGGWRRRAGGRPAESEPTAMDRRNIRLYLKAEVTQEGPTALGRAEVPPISQPSATRAIQRGAELVEAAGSRFNPDRPPPRVRRDRRVRALSSPVW